MKLTNIFFLFILTVNVNAFEISEDQKKRLEQMIRSQVSDHSPGLAIGIVNNEEVVYEQYLGYANLNDNILISSDTKFNYASVAKQLTAFILLELCLEKGISLDEDFRQYLPDFYPGNKDKISIKNLISHSSGIRDYPVLLNLQSKPWWKQVGLSNRSVLKLIKKQRTLNFTPGTAYAYSNTNYTIITALINHFSGVDFETHSNAFFDRMGMKQTYFNPGYMHIVKNKALPYSSWESGVWKQYPMLSNLNGDGFLYTTLTDQLKWETHLQQNFQDQINLLIQQPLFTDAVNSYGFGLEFADFYGHKSIEHSGSTGSYNSHLLRLPGKSISIVVLSNNGSISSRDLAVASAKIVLDINEDESAQMVNKALNFNGENKYAKNDLVGSYFLNENTVVKITLKEGDLFREIEQREPIRLISKGNDVYQYESMDFLHVAFEKDGDLLSFKLHQTGLAPRLAVRFNPEQISDKYKKSINGRYYNDELDVYFVLRFLEANTFELSFNNKTFKTSMYKKGYLNIDGYQLRIEQSKGIASEKLYLNYGNSRNISFMKIAAN
ncbi:serine hydrolase domain-containing protein [Marinicella sp. W31]|uniref:serine hydrolase domain-containing protein n=1 Tax=Marinicella sp. W31 TaxID=3023713 RepID=UPI0037582B82